LPQWTARGERVRTGKKWLVTDQCQVFLFLYWMKHYPTFWNMSFIFAICELYIASILKRVSYALHSLATTLPRDKGGIGTFPAKEEIDAYFDSEKAMKPPGMEKFWLAVDGVRFWIKQPAGRPDLFNQKDKRPSVLALIGTTVAGDIAYVSDIYENQNENFILRETKLRDIIQNSREGVVADAGIHFNTERDETEKGRILAEYTMGPKSLNRSKKILKEILILLANDAQDVDGARGQLLEKIAIELRTALHNTRLASSLRIVVECVIGDIKGWRIFSAQNRSWHREAGHDQTVNLNHLWKGACFLYRYMKFARGYFARRPQWQSLQANRLPWQELDNRPCNAQVWAWRVRQYDGNNGGQARLIELETGSPLFIALWEKLMPKNLDWKEEKKLKYKKSAAFVNTFKVWLEEYEEEDHSLPEEEDADDDELCNEDDIGFLFASLPHKRKVATVLERNPHLIERGPLHYNSPKHELEKLNMLQLARILILEPRDLESGRVFNIYTLAQSYLEDNVIERARVDTLLLEMKRQIDGLTALSGQKVLKRKLAELKKETNAEERKRRELKSLCETIVSTYESLNLSDNAKNNDNSNNSK
jgi:hypothetical protein